MKHATLACVTTIVGLLFLPGTLRAQSATTAAPQTSGAPAAHQLPGTIPIFPLPDVVLFPSVTAPLYVFEPRYLAMVTDALRGNRIIGLVMLQPGYEANYEGRPPINPIGCAGIITESEPLPDGRIGIVLTGLVKFRVTSEDNSRPYRLAQVTAIPEVASDEDRVALRKQRQRLEAMLADPRPGAEPRFPPSVADDALINALAQRMNIEPSDRQALLELPGALSRAQGLIDLLEKLTRTR